MRMQYSKERLESGVWSLKSVERKAESSPSRPSRLQTPDSRLQTSSDSRLQTPDFRLNLRNLWIQLAGHLAEQRVKLNGLLNLAVPGRRGGSTAVEEDHLSNWR